VADLVIMAGDPVKDHGVIGNRMAALFKEGMMIINNCN
jgi:hypothetical protein